MNKANLLFDWDYFLKRYGKKIIKRIPEIKKIISAEIIPHKDNIWETTYHVVVEYKIKFEKKDETTVVLSIFCSAHSSEPRKNVYDSMKFLWSHGFNNNDGLIIPRPLFYSKFFRGTFYVGVAGADLYYFIREKKFKEIEAIVAKAAKLFAKLHSLPIKEAYNFNKDNSRIKTVKPGMKNVLEKIKNDFPEHYEKFKKCYEKASQAEVEFLLANKKRWIVHGDAHPENIIKMAGSKLAIIDFTDICLSDFTRDLGSFSQQLDFKIMRRIGDAAYALKIKKLFFENYFKNAKIKADHGLEERIENYYNWTALRTSSFFLLKHNPEPERAFLLLNEIWDKMK